MAEVMNSLFGITPESLMAERENALQAQAMQYARLDPFQRATAGIYAGANKLGGAFGGMLGAQDPEMMRLQQRQSMLQGLDLTDPESVKQGIQAAMQNKDYQAVGELTNRYQDLAKTALATRKTESEITKNLREKEGADPVQQLIRTGKYTVASVADYQQSGNIADLVPVDPSEPTALSETSEGIFLVNKKDGTKIARIGSAPERGTKNIVNVDAKGEAEFSKELGKLDAQKVSAAGTARENAFATVRSLNQLEKLDDQGLISGSFATGRVGATNLLNTLGLASPADQQRLATSQNYQKVSGDVILGTLGGKLGAGFSNEDRKFIEGLVPQLETSAAARRQLITFMRNKNLEVAEEATRLENYARDNKGLKGFQPKIPLGTPAPVSSMSADDLAKAAGGKIVNGKFVPNK
jgi:hypothetical protein